MYYKTVPKCLANPLSSGAWNTEQLRFLLEADRSSICHQVFPRMPARTRQLILFSSIFDDKPIIFTLVLQVVFIKMNWPIPVLDVNIAR